MLVQLIVIRLWRSDLMTPHNLIPYGGDGHTALSLWGGVARAAA